MVIHLIALRRTLAPLEEAEALLEKELITLNTDVIFYLIATIVEVKCQETVRFVLRILIERVFLLTATKCDNRYLWSYGIQN